ncbi:hypothetical protein S245_000803 [Arachis hypogaea]
MIEARRRCSLSLSAQRHQRNKTSNLHHRHHHHHHHHQPFYTIYSLLSKHSPKPPLHQIPQKIGARKVSHFRENTSDPTISLVVIFIPRENSFCLRFCVGFNWKNP